MKKILILLVGLLILNLSTQAETIPKALTDSAAKHLKDGSKTLYKDAKAFYQTDVKSVISYGVNKTEQAVDTLYKLLGKGYTQLSKGAAHTFEVLKTQQLVKSLHHLFYWILGILLSIIIVKKYKNFGESIKERDWVSLLALITLDSILVWYNAINFMEMWTGFINPEYGVYMEILEYLNK